MDIPAQKQRGHLKVLIGYAAGVGKTYRMLEEAHELQAKGVEVVIGYIEPHGRAETIAKTEGLEIVPRRRLDYRGTQFEEMDTEAILRRHPQVCLVDEFAHTNVPGSERAKRWEDVWLLLEAGIDVMTTMNIQHLESLTDQVQQVTGIQVRETVPDWVIKQADEIVMVDLTASALIHRLQRGVVYAPEKASKALENFFKESNLVSLRELALRQTAHEVDSRQTVCLPRPTPQVSGIPVPVASKPQEKFLVLVTGESSNALLIRRAWRMADYLQAECYAAYIQRPHSPSIPDSAQKHLRFARELHIETRILEGDDATETLVRFAHTQGITNIFLAQPIYNLWSAIIVGNFIHKVVRLAEDIQVTIVAERRYLQD
jgi:two-component system, OmpR family, sensor histidine kinase KdpD